MENRTVSLHSDLSNFLRGACIAAFICQLALTVEVGAQSVTKTPSSVPVLPLAFASPQEAADALIDAAAKFDLATLKQIVGAEGKDILFTGETARDRELAAAFAAQARKKKSIVLDPQNKSRAILSVGPGDWPFAAPIIKKGGKWSFDVEAGRKELLYRRIGSNELDAIRFCHGYVEAQHEYGLQKRNESSVNQYAQRIISTPGKQDGLAWQNPDGTWGGPVGEKVARVIEQGYTSRTEPYHGYYFKVLKGQGRAAPLGVLDFVVNGVMIGGFALAAAPAEYGVTGVKSFIVSHDGIVYEKDRGPRTLEIFKSMERYNPDKTWTPVR